MKIGSAKEAAAYAALSLEMAGIRVVDTSVLPGGKIFDDDNEVIIVAGYVPGKAGIISIRGNFSKTVGANGWSFKMYGWLKTDCPGMKYERFEDVPRCAKGYESYSGRGKYFYINHYALAYPEDGGNLDEAIRDAVGRGISFYRRIIDNYGNFLEGCFPECVDLWFVPEYSDALLEFEERNGRYNDNNYTIFNYWVIRKFPPGLLAVDQRL